MRKLTHAEIKAKRKTAGNINDDERNPVYVLCDNIRSIYNVGSIFRTSDAALIKKLYLTGYTPYPPRKEIDKVALGATLTVPWEYYRDPIDIILKLKSEGVKIGVLEITDSKNLIWNFNKSNLPICLILGNEISGVSKELIDLADVSYEIPMFGMKQSLNVSVSYGIAVYEIIRNVANY